MRDCFIWSSSLKATCLCRIALRSGQQGCHILKALVPPWVRRLQAKGTAPSRPHSDFLDPRIPCPDGLEPALGACIGPFPGLSSWGQMASLEYALLGARNGQLDVRQGCPCAYLWDPLRCRTEPEVRRKGGQGLGTSSPVQLCSGVLFHAPENFKSELVPCRL